MQDERSNDVPQSPPTQPADVREELDQQNISKQGTPRSADDAGAGMDSHFGAVEDTTTGQSDQVTVTPPMEGPYTVTGGDDKQDEDVDPQDEIMGG